jgi:hypothetical protein
VLWAPISFLVQPVPGPVAQFEGGPGGPHHVI